MENLLKITKIEEKKFDFHKASIFLMKEKKMIDTPYNKALVNRFLNLEKHVYEFYNKKYSD